MPEKNERENCAARMKLDDNSLDAVAGGGSIYEDAAGIERESWFVTIVKKLMTDGENADAASQQGGK